MYLARPPLLTIMDHVSCVYINPTSFSPSAMAFAVYFVLFPILFSGDHHCSFAHRRAFVFMPRALFDTLDCAGVGFI